MKALRVDVDGTVGYHDFATDLSYSHVAMPLVSVSEFVEKASPGTDLIMWIDDDGALGDTGLKPNPLVNKLLPIIGYEIPADMTIHGYVIFTEDETQLPDADVYWSIAPDSLQASTEETLRGILHRLTVENLDAQPRGDGAETVSSGG